MSLKSAPFIRTFAILLTVALLAPGAPGQDKAQRDQKDQKEVDIGDFNGLAENFDPSKTKDAKTADKKKTPRVGWIVLKGSLSDSPPPFNWIDAESDVQTTRSIVTQLDYLAASQQHTGAVFFLDQAKLSLSQVDELSRAFKRVRAKGKKIVTFAEAYDTPGYLLACAADRIVLQKKGGMMVPGIGAEEIYMAGLFEKIGVKADMIQVGKFKGAAEPMTRSEPSQFWSKNMDAMLDDLWEQVVTHIADGRGKTPAQIEAALAKSLAATDKQLVKLGLVDELADRDLLKTTDGLFGADFTWDKKLGVTKTKNSATANPFALLTQLFEPSETKISRASIAVITASGPITSGDSSFGDGLFSSEGIGSRTMVKALGKARSNDLVKGVIIRINSPGGSALASEMIWQSVRDVAEKKPVYISVGPMAASGGYYIACAGDRIYVAPSSIVGSIGVVGGKIVLGDLYEKVGLTVHRRSRGPHGDLFNSVEGFTPKQRKAITASMKQVYNQFTGRVAAGRGKRIPNIGQVAQGRIFTGKQAVANGLADEVGGLKDVIAALAAKTKLKEGGYDVVTLPEPMSLGEYLDSLLNVQSPQPGISIAVQDPAVNLARQALGPRTWREITRYASGLMLLRDEHVLALMPAPIVVK